MNYADERVLEDDAERNAAMTDRSTTSDELALDYPNIPLSSSHVRLRPLLPTDYHSLRNIELSEGNIHKWRHRGTTPSPDAYAAQLSNGVLAMFMVDDLRRQGSVGFVSAYNPSHIDGWCYIAAFRFASEESGICFLKGSVLFIDYLFRSWPFHKLYAESFEMNVGAFRTGLGRMFEVEGCLKRSVYYDGDYRDKYILSVTRERWNQRGRSFVEFAMRSAPVVAE
jgi:hypothetical protein